MLHADRKSWPVDVIKVFPATSLGPKYFKDISGPFPRSRLSCRPGGVSIDNVGEWVKVGAVAVRWQRPPRRKGHRGRALHVLTEKASRLVKNFNDAKKNYLSFEIVLPQQLGNGACGGSGCQNATEAISSCSGKYRPPERHPVIDRRAEILFEPNWIHDVPPIQPEALLRAI